jgi:hypothetical protein
MRVARMGVEHHAAMHRAFGPRRGCAIASACAASCATFYWLNTHALAQSCIVTISLVQGCFNTTICRGVSSVARWAGHTPAAPGRLRSSP